MIAPHEAKAALAVEAQGQRTQDLARHHAGEAGALGSPGFEAQGPAAVELPAAGGREGFVEGLDLAGHDLQSLDVPL